MHQIHRLDSELVLPLVPPTRRRALALLWKIDARLGEMARSGKEPALRQIRLKWWEDQLAALTAEARPPEPLLAEIAAELVPVMLGAALAELAAAWGQYAVADDGVDTVAHGARLFAQSAALLGGVADGAVEAAGEGWARVEALLAKEAEASDGRWHDANAALAVVRLHRLPRALAAISGVARQIARYHGVRSAGAEQWTLFRIGLIGR